MTQPDLPTIPFTDGEYRFRGARYVGECYVVRLQRKGWFFWRTVSKGLYWPSNQYITHTPYDAAVKAIAEHATTLSRHFTTPSTKAV